MSSPLATFRKHRTYWMAALVLLAILAFVVQPAIVSMMDYMRVSSAPGNEVVVRWAGGKVTVGTLEYVRLQHARTLRFLQALAREVLENQGVPKVPGFRYDPQTKRVEDLGLPALDTNQAVCRTMIIAERGKQLGLEFDKEVVNDFLSRFCDRKISNARFEEILRETGGRELSFPELHRQLALELSAVVMERVALAGVNYEGRPLVTPGSLWQNYLQLNRFANVEAYPVLVKDFIKEVKQTPSEVEIRTIYEAGAMNFPSPNSPEPGFRRRYQANLEYVSGSMNKLIDQEKKNFTEEQLKAEYDRLVGLGGLKVPDEPKAEETKPADAKDAPTGDKPSDKPSDKPATDKPAGDKASTEKPAEKMPAKATDAGSNGANAVKPDEGQAPAPAGKPKTEETKPAESKAEDKPADATEKPAEEKPKSEEPKQSRVMGDSAIRLVAFQQTEGKDDGVPPPVTDPAPPVIPAAPDIKAAAGVNTPPPAVAEKDKDASSAAKLDAASKSDDSAKPAETKPADAKPVEAKPGDANSAAAPAAPMPSGNQAAPAPGTATTAEGATAPAAPATPPMRTQTFEEAKESIARSLALPKVRESLEAKLKKIEIAMNAYSSAAALDRINEANGVKSEKKAVKIDLKKLAEEEGLTYGSTGMSDGFRLAGTPVGRSLVGGQMGGQQSLANVIMNPGIELYRPVRSMYFDMEGMSPDIQDFIAWKFEDQQAYTPELNDIRDEVIEAWKTIKARDLARAEADKLADKLKKATDEGWKGALDAQQETLVVKPTPFSWMSGPTDMFAPPQVTFVQGLDSVGNQFMSQVFDTAAKQFTVAPNQGLNTYYVVRVVEFSPTEEQLRQNFEASRGRAGQLAFPERELLFRDWYDDIENRLNVQWLASADQLMN